MTQKLTQELIAMNRPDYVVELTNGVSIVTALAEEFTDIRFVTMNTIQTGVNNVPGFYIYREGLLIRNNGGKQYFELTELMARLLKRDP